ncbi:MAG: hypothetical protein ACI85Q_000685 [Salibacteraceae bacterium]|jgi:hypothetical protein
MNTILKYRFLFPLLAAIFVSQFAVSQFYRGSYQEFGKNRLQFFQPNWQHQDYENFNVYFYGTGRPLADYVAKEGHQTLSRLQELLDYRMRGKVFILIFNTQSEFQQSNIGLEIPEADKIGGTTHLQGNKLFVYFDGSHKDFQRQIRGGLTEVIVRQLMFGESWKEMVKNSALMNIPDWYIDGLVSYSTRSWSVEIDDQLRDLVLNGKMNKINRLNGSQSTFAGHALWYYISEVYGPEVIPNILYMSKISRSIESGFLFVLGQSMDGVVEAAQKYYLAKYISDDAQRTLPDSEPLKIRTKKTRTYQALSLSPDAEYIAFTSNEMGQYKVFIKDLDKKRVNRIMKGNHKLERIPDVSYPLLSWSPSSDILAVIYEKKGIVLLELYDMETKKWDKRELVRVEKVLGFNFSHDGKKLVISAIKNSQSDLFVFSLLQNSMRQVTNDIYDDLTPSFIPNTNKIIFASNRGSDSVNIKTDVSLLMDNTDLFIYDYKEKPKVYNRLVNSQDYDENQPFALSEKYFTYLSGENGIKNRYVGQVDSSISYIDTTIHYRFFTKTSAVSNYKRNILFQSMSVESKKFAQMIRYKGEFQFYVEDFKDVREEQLDITNFGKTIEKKKEAISRLKLATSTPFKVVKSPSHNQDLFTDSLTLDIHNYTFGDDIPKVPQTSNGPIKNSKLITLKTAQSQKEEKKTEPVKAPKQENYRLAFTATDITTAVNFEFANQLYQPFNGGPYSNPGTGMVFKISLFDIMEDHNITGGGRYGLNGASKEWFLTYTDRTKRMDKEYSFQRQKLDQTKALTINTGEIANYPAVSITNQAKLALSWPFSEVLALKSTINLRNDRIITKSIDAISRDDDDINKSWAGLKFELIFDDTRDIDINIKNGTRFKIFGESYAELADGIKDINIIGADFRTYTKIHRNIVWANRIAGSTSFGQRKLVYYLGAVDEWVNFGERFNTSQNIAMDQNYYWQALATNMRGFQQNIRNGNTFVVINSELRIPLFQYLISKPIKSQFVKSFQLIGFGDLGTAWNGPDPYSDENAFNTRTVSSGGGDVIVRLNNKKDPLVGAVGFGFRTKILGYYLRYDHAYGIEDGEFLKSRGHLSIGLDF